jgi:hypothetical protein
LLGLAEPPPGAPKLLRAAALFARSILARAHLSAYQRARPTDDALLKRWELPVAVARLAEVGPSERSKLIPYIEARL